jgi:hypothetical protein
MQLVLKPDTAVTLSGAKMRADRTEAILAALSLCLDSQLCHSYRSGTHHLLAVSSPQMASQQQVSSIVESREEEFLDRGYWTRLNAS